MVSLAEGFRPLCPELFELLEDRFGEVRIASEGEELVAAPTFNPADGNVRWDFQAHGEQYLVNCPFCNDTRHRLSISYCYGQVDPVTKRAAIWLARCFNEECVASDMPRGMENRQALEQLIFGFINREERINRFRIEPGRSTPRTLGPVALPGLITTLDKLPPHHHAVQYVEGRGYDAHYLGASLGVGYCVESDPAYPSARGRLIIPIVMDGVLVGWQGRYVGDLDWKSRRIPKYYNLPRQPKSLMLYNLDNAARGRIVVVVESVTSVWSLGDASVAVLGKTISRRQCELLEGRWARRGCLLVLILDLDAQRQAERQFPVLSNTFIGYEGGAAIMMTMPDGKDPGDFDRETAWDMIYLAGDKAGVDVESYVKAD
jgi:hypothetical protein